MVWCPGEAGVGSGQPSQRAGDRLAGVPEVCENSSSKAECSSLVSKRGLSNFGHSNRDRTLSAFLFFGSGKKAGLCWEQNWGAAEVLDSLGCRSLCEGSASCTVAVLSQLSWDRLFTKKRAVP